VLRLFDTASRELQELAPRVPGSIGMYVCGPTVYGPPHVGHGRMALVYDIIRRYLEYSGFAVRHVSNVTDIDDKIIARSLDERRSWKEVADGAEAQWWAAMDWLGLLRPTDVPHATDYIDGMVELIDELVRRGSAYETSDGVYFASATVADYGLLAHQNLDSLLGGARIEVIEEKRSPADFALWKKAKPGEPIWTSPFGAGRPGWHTECVVMSLALLGEGFELHGGGLDLVCPHHEDERAQAVAAGRAFSRLWVHNGLVEGDGEKMSKSLGNVVDLATLSDRADPRSLRLLVLRARYRSPIEVGTDAINDAESALSRIDGLQRRFHDAPVAEVETATLVSLRREFSRRMDDDLDTPGALALLFESLREANALADRGDTVGGAALAQAVLELFAVLGLQSGATDELPGEIALLKQRYESARAGGDYAASDALRAELSARGWRVEVTPTGTRVFRLG
jgi:cysteinyl-tRNA synthetase